MRFVPAIVLAAAAGCGTEAPTHGPDGSPDGGVRDGSSVVVDATPIPPDGIPAGLAPCEEAVYHSDLAWIQSRIFDVSCTTMCHGASPPAGMLNLRPAASRLALVNVQGYSHPDWIRVVPGDPKKSLLMVEIGGEPGIQLEGYMPWQQPMLCTQKIDAIRRWIAAGAPE